MSSVPLNHKRLILCEGGALLSRPQLPEDLFRASTFHWPWTQHVSLGTALEKGAPWGSLVCNTQSNQMHAPHSRRATLVVRLVSSTPIPGLSSAYSPSLWGKTV